MADAARKLENRQYVVDEQGRRTAVVLPIDEYEELLEAAEQRDDIRHLEEAQGLSGETVAWEQVKEQLRSDGKLP